MAQEVLELEPCHPLEVAAPAQRGLHLGRQFRRHLVDHELDELALRRDMGVQRHRADTEALRDRTHRQGVKAVVVGHGDPGADDLVD
jgi:hypothetical protein